MVKKQVTDAIKEIRKLTISASDELVESLLSNPTDQAILDYFISDELQARSNRLLELNSENEISEAGRIELAQLGELEHIMIMLKASVFERIE